MAFRGRGRGGFGGFRGIQRHDIQLADDEKVSDVPSNFPACDSMPKRFEDDATPEMQRRLKRFNTLRAVYTKSPFFIPRPQRDEQEGSAPDVRRRIEVPAASAKSKAAQPALSQVIFMHAKYLPEELYSAKDQRQSLQKRSAAFFMAHGHLQDASFENRLKALAEEEAKARIKGEDADDDAQQKEQGKKDDDEEGAAPQEEEDDELDHEDDDYYQGENFDDDEEYGDNDDGGNDEPYF